jgi:hypothetical protein
MTAWLGKGKLKGFGSGRNFVGEISWHFVVETGENQETAQL